MRDETDRRVVVGNGCLPSRELTTPAGRVEVTAPRVHGPRPDHGFKKTRAITSQSEKLASWYTYGGNQPHGREQPMPGRLSQEYLQLLGCPRGLLDLRDGTQLRSVTLDTYGSLFEEDLEVLAARIEERYG